MATKRGSRSRERRKSGKVHKIEFTRQPVSTSELTGKIEVRLKSILIKDTIGRDIGREEGIMNLSQERITKGM